MVKPVTNAAPPRIDNGFEHRCRHGSVFRCTKINFTEPVIVTNWPRSNDGELDGEGFASDVAEMIGFHAVNIWPTLNGFAGYDCITWDLRG